ncbi:hypothetical protein [Legionella hackeliae]|uniref:Uncharacterized protein n=1 Tax=Legionella hackeliae TaxID=449 RepID=A0A0A8UQZ6_LEGHA|nr:hypothetical protein [Legionella hackeliae]KTD10450.1 hypothetical protein Lhac_2818 [Legionella hackeliae]CEK09951.1 protein of unknown function [Legionella hackeliae]STX49865.1 Uncharacterised protein [Legionella hackeliae]
MDKSEIYRQANIPSLTINYGAISNLEVSLTTGLLYQKQFIHAEDTEEPSLLRGYGFTDINLTLK